MGWAIEEERFISPKQRICNSLFIFLFSEVTSHNYKQICVSLVKNLCHCRWMVWFWVFPWFYPLKSIMKVGHQFCNLSSGTFVMMISLSDSFCLKIIWSWQGIFLQIMTIWLVPAAVTHFSSKTEIVMMSCVSAVNVTYFSSNSDDELCLSC